MARSGIPGRYGRAPRALNPQRFFRPVTPVKTAAFGSLSIVVSMISTDSQQIATLRRAAGRLQRGSEPPSFTRDRDNRWFSGTIAGTIALAQNVAGRI